MFWFDRNNDNVLFIDNRIEKFIVKDKSSSGGHRLIDVCPDIVADFTDLPLENESFYLVVFDPPHLKSLGESSWMAKKYGKLDAGWKDMIRKGFDECFRVLKTNGTLVFKWNEHEIPLRDVLDIISYKPLFGHRTGRQSKTMWLCFMKGVS